MAFDQVCSERNLDKEVVLETIEVAILTAYKKDFGSAQNVTVKLDPETGQANIYTTKEVVEQVQDERFEISLDEAKRSNEDAELGELVMFENTPKRFGRIAAQTAKQVILQRIREAEREVLFNSYAERAGELINGTVQNIMPQGVTLNLGRTEALLPRSQQISGECTATPRPLRRASAWRPPAGTASASRGRTTPTAALTARTALPIRTPASCRRAPRTSATSAATAT